ncbi:class I SAM-dependent methyltransferase [Campylobacter lari]|nr:class I SAM-dependent methyltransferase [Campylobacter lari]EAH9953071.1 class I SAM-dependent methyltransferase [Campylobacter lari]EAI1237908.1 class I SAM-dependent methyltransferase [Campylobacter lari]EAI4305266.1 class I SAM-dependent methyltransferase [Campylobacter lari]EAK0800012.1 class I SAM-dependent methyltransferase [Campylobacter lari]
MELVRWFFKNKLDTLENAKVLEFASHNGNNLSLFANYNYECIGVELSKQNHENAIYNFKEIMHYQKASFFNENMLDFAKNHQNINADVFLIPNVINYISKEDFKNLLLNSKNNNLYSGKKYAHFFLRARSTKDHRYGLGNKLSNGSFLLTNDDFSGEKNCLCTAYQEHELVEILKENLNLYDFEVITSENINIKNKVYIKDSDIIIYGKITKE